MGRERGRTAALLTWGLLTLFLLWSAWFFALVWLPEQITVGCFDGNEAACSNDPAPTWLRALRWVLWLGALVACALAVRRARRNRNLSLPNLLASPLVAIALLGTALWLSV